MDTLTLLSLCLSLLLVVLCGRAIWFYGYAAYAALHEQIQGGPIQIDPAGLSEFYPKLTVVKLLQKGETATTLQSFCRQCYPHYQIVFAIEASDRTAAQIAAVEKLIQQFPEQDIDCVTYPAQPKGSAKATGLSYALKFAKFDVWVLADCASMAPDALHHLVQPFRYPSVGAVQGLQLQSTGWLGQWQAFALVAEWYPELLVARHQTGIYGMPSSVMAIRKAAVMQLGGVETALPDLATGMGLGNQLAKIGYRVASCHLHRRFKANQVPEAAHALPAGSILTMLQQQLNQMRLVRNLHPWRYALKGTIYGSVASLFLLWIWQGASWVWYITALTGLSRLTMTYLISVGCFKAPSLWRFGLLLPFYDLISFSLWCLGWFGSAFQKQSFPPPESFEQAERVETELLSLLVQPAKVKGT